MSISEPFIRRPIGTSLLMLGNRWAWPSLAAS